MTNDMTPLARQLRDNCTYAEYTLWNRLRNRQLRGFKFRRQAPRGSYVVDFLCAEAKLIVEVDGGRHSETVLKDNERTAYLDSLGYAVLRFWNNEVMNNIDGVLEVISDALSDRQDPLTPPSPQGERE
jgi:very-short-patch-repair endonuclease